MVTQYTKNFRLALPDFRSGPWHDLVNGDFTQIDSIIYGALSGADTPAWAHSTHYSPGQQVIDTDGATTWMNNVDHTSAATGTFEAERTAHPTYWVQLLAGFAPRGEWANSTQYYPYDLAYETTSGIFAQCKTKHTSNASGFIEDDAVYWYWIVNFSGIGASPASAISYIPATGLTAINVQAAIDQVEAQIISLNGVNVTQGNQITTLQNTDATYNTRMTTIEGVNTTQNTNITGNANAITALAARVTALETAPPPSSFPSGTRLVFCQANPPTGWTVVSGIHDKALRIVTDASGGGMGGTLGFATVFANTVTGGHALTIAELAAHTHGYNDEHPVAGPSIDLGGATTAGANAGVDAARTTSSQGSGVAHTHPMDIRLAYVNCFVGNKT